MHILFPEIGPYAQHKLAVDPLHTLYIEECGYPGDLNFGSLYSLNKGFHFESFIFVVMCQLIALASHQANLSEK